MSIRTSTTTRSPTINASSSSARPVEGSGDTYWSGREPLEATSCSGPTAAEERGWSARPVRSASSAALTSLPRRHTRRSLPGGPGPSGAHPGGCQTRPPLDDPDPPARRWGHPRPGRQSCPAPAPTPPRPPASDPGWEPGTTPSPWPPAAHSSATGNPTTLLGNEDERYAVTAIHVLPCRLLVLSVAGEVKRDRSTAEKRSMTWTTRPRTRPRNSRAGQERAGPGHR